MPVQTIHDLLVFNLSPWSFHDSLAHFYSSGNLLEKILYWHGQQQLMRAFDKIPTFFTTIRKKMIWNAGKNLGYKLIAKKTALFKILWARASEQQQQREVDFVPVLISLSTYWIFSRYFSQQHSRVQMRSCQVHPTPNKSAQRLQKGSHSVAINGINNIWCKR